MPTKRRSTKRIVRKSKRKSKVQTSRPSLKTYVWEVHRSENGNTTRIVEKAIAIAEEICFRKATDIIKTAVKLCKQRDLRTITANIISDAAKSKCECPMPFAPILPPSKIETFIRLTASQFRVGQDAGLVLASVVENYLRNVLSMAKKNCIDSGMKTLYPRHFSKQ